MKPHTAALKILNTLSGGPTYPMPAAATIPGAEGFLTVPRAARLACVSPWSVWRMIRQGRLRAFGRVGMYRILLTDLLPEVQPRGKASPTRPSKTVPNRAARVDRSENPRRSA